jgi:hypothetical protein
VPASPSGRTGPFGAAFCGVAGIAPSAGLVEVCFLAGNREVYQPRTIPD